MICAYVLVISTFLPDTIAAGASGRHCSHCSITFRTCKMGRAELKCKARMLSRISTQLLAIITGAKISYR